MELLKKVGRAVRAGVIELATPTAPAPEAGENRELDVERAITTGLQAEIVFYMRRSQEYFALIAKMEAQREEWRLLYRNDSLGHQNAQTLLQEALVTSRTQLYRAIQMINAFRKEKGDEPIADEAMLERELRAYPVGVEEATAKRLAGENAAVAPQIDPVAETAKIDAAIVVPEGVVDESHTPAPETDPQTS